MATVLGELYRYRAETVIESFQDLPVAQYEFRLAACEDAVCYPILGSTLRGAFGGALKDVSCTVRHRNCEICLLNTACNYTVLFEPQTDKSAPRPFTFQIPVPPLNPKLSVDDSLRLRIKKGGIVPFGLTVFGTNALARLPYIIYAVGLMAQTGLGMPRKEFCLQEVKTAGAAIFDAEQQNAPRYAPQQTTLRDLCEKRLAGLYVQDRLTIRFLSPVWLREDGRLVEKPAFFHLVKFLLKRLKNIAAHYSLTSFDLDETELLDRSREIGVIGESLWRHDFEFYSNKRGRKEHQAGILGEMTVAGKDLDLFLPLLAAGEVLHIGSKTSFGLGRYEIL